MPYFSRIAVSRKARAAANLLKVLVAAGIWLGWPGPAAAFDLTGWTCTGTCGTLGVDGVVPLAPVGNSASYGWISSKNGKNGTVPKSLASVIGASITNGSILVSPAFSAKGEEKLSFYFNFITSDGAQYADFGWVRLLDGAGNQKAILFTARTNQSSGGNTVPGFGMPLISGGTLTPPNTPIKSGGPKWSPLANSSGTCYSTGCGHTGWIKMEYIVPEEGTYVLELGVANWLDQAYDTGMAFDGFMIGDHPLIPGCTADKFVPPAIASNANQIAAGTVVYQATYDSTNWSGHLYAWPFVGDSDGNFKLGAKPDWDAAANIPPYASRGGHIYTWHPSKNQGSPFTWSALDPNLQAMLAVNNFFEKPITNFYDGQKMLQYIAGDKSNESPNGAKYRNRISLLGDIIGSSPVYVGKPTLRYQDSIEPSAPYSKFAKDKAGRTPVVYVGANDGMLHAFRAKDGVEEFAYVPSAVFPKLSDMASPTYNHQFYVDGTPLVSDAFFDASWHTVLVGGLNAGGQGIYALDVTDPSHFDDTSVLWEFGDRQTAAAGGVTNYDADLGYTHGTPYIARVRDKNTPTQNRWVAIFGNGYKNTDADGSVSATGNAVLYVVNLQNGDLIKKFDTGYGKAQDASGGNPNGLLSPTPVDVDGDGNVEYVYAGDLQGHMWKFDLADADPSGWKIALEGKPLFTAIALDGKPQPITAAPEVGPAPKTLSGLMVYFGTGRLLEILDTTITTPTNSFYAIWDDMSTSAKRSDLMQQTISEVGTWRTMSNNPVDWKKKKQRGWYMDLTASPSKPTTERSVSSPQLNNGRLIFTTVVPSASEDGCTVTGKSWLMVVNPLTGGPLDFAPFDVNNDGVFTDADLIGGNIAAGMGINDLVSPSLVLGYKGKSVSVLNPSGAGANTGPGPTPPPKTEDINNPKSSQRMSWRDLSVSP